MKNQCFLCGRKIVQGGLHYNINIKIESGFDGFIDKVIETDSAQQLLDKLEKMDIKDIEDDLFRELSFKLCKKCRKDFLDYLIGDKLKAH